LFSKTTIENVDLTSVDLGATRHDAPSTVALSTLATTGGRIRQALPGKRNELTRFLVACGVPEGALPWSIMKESSAMLQSTFLSYGGPDSAFASRLNDALRARGVATFFFNGPLLPQELGPA
jgi:hypothetical protein